MMSVTFRELESVDCRIYLSERGETVILAEDEGLCGEMYLFDLIAMV